MAKFDPLADMLEAASKHPHDEAGLRRYISTMLVAIENLHVSEASDAANALHQSLAKAYATLRHILPGLPLSADAASMVTEKDKAAYDSVVALNRGLVYVPYVQPA